MSEHGAPPQPRDLLLSKQNRRRGRATTTSPRQSFPLSPPLSTPTEILRSHPDSGDAARPCAAADRGRRHDHAKAAMDEGYSNLPTSHLLGSVPAVTLEERKPDPGGPAEAATSRLQQFPPVPGANGGGYQPPGTPRDGDVETQTNWKGYFNVASYAPYFNVDTDVVIDRLISSVYPMDGFFRKIDANPDMYGPLWITTTLIFMLAAFGNFATYLMQKKTNLNIWNFDVGYFNWATSVMYGYAIVVPAAFFFLFQYFGSRPSLVRFWCMWGYSLFIFIPASILLLIPVEFLRWVIIVLAGGASSWFIALNLKECTERADMMALIASAAALQFALALFIKVFFFA